MDSLNCQKRIRWKYRFEEQDFFITAWTDSLSAVKDPKNREISTRSRQEADRQIR